MPLELSGWMCDVTNLDRISNDIMRGGATKAGEMSNKLHVRHAIRRNEECVRKERCISIRSRRT